TRQNDTLPSVLFSRVRLVFALLLVLTWTTLTARADKIDNLARTLMQDPSYKVRVQAALVLGRLADKRTIRALIQALKDEHESVRGVAAASLGRIGDKSAADALLNATNDPSDFVRIQAKKALESIANAPEPLDISERAGAKFYLSIGFLAPSKFGDRYS